MPVAVDDAALVSRCLKGERNAYDVLVQKYQTAAFGLAFSYAHNADDASDLVQDAFVLGYLNLEGLKERTRFGAWLKTILVNRARKQYRRKRKTVELKEASIALQNLAADRFAQKEQHQEIWDQVNTLDEIYRVPITLFYGAGLPYEEIAQFLDVPVSTVRGRLQKARRQLKDVMIEDMEMTTTDVSERVQDEICKIARAEIEETIDPGESKHLALFFGVPTRVKIVGGDGDQIVIRGHKVAVGETEAGAQKALENMKTMHDEVDDWIAKGQHPGAHFAGTNSTNNGQPEAIVGKSGGKIKVFDQIYNRFFGYVYTEDVFPHLAPAEELLNRIREALPVGAVRFSTVFKEVLDVVLPKTALNDEVLEGLKVNHTNEDVAHGPSGRITVEIAVPSGVAVTINNGDDVSIEGVNANVLCLRGQVERVSDVEGDVFLLHTSARYLTDIQGNVALFDHLHPSGGGQAKRLDAPVSQIESVSGDVVVNVSYLDVQIRHVSGKVDVQNRIGNTELRFAKWTAENRCRVHSVAGDISFKIKKPLIEEVSIAGAILAGTMHYRPLHDVVEKFNQANDQRMRYFSTVNGSRDHYQDADVFLSSENGHLDVNHFE